MAKKKILYIITKSNFGGAQRYVFDLTTSLKDTYDIAVAFGGEGLLKTKLEAAGIRTISIPSLQRDVNPFLDFKSFLDLVSLFKKERPDIVHLNSPKVGGLGALAARVTGVKKIIYTAHGWTFNEKRSAPSLLAIRLLSWITTLLSSEVIVIAEREKRQGLAMPFSKNKIKLIKNGVREIDFKEKAAARAAIAEKISSTIDPDVLWIGTISELHKNKGLNFMIDAVADIKRNFVFIILGGGEEKENLDKQIKEKGLEKKVFLAGFVDNASTYLKAFDIFTLTSVKEGLPYAILEAGLAGLPVIASGVGGIPEIIENEKSGLLVPAGDISAIKNAVTELIADGHTRAEYAHTLNNTVVKDFSIEKMVRETELIYNK